MWSVISMSSLTLIAGRRLPAAFDKNRVSTPATFRARIMVRSGYESSVS